MRWRFWREGNPEKNPRSRQARLCTVLYFSVRSPRSHANSETGAIFVYNASATDDNPPRGWVSGGGGGLDAYHSPQRSYLRRPPPRWIVVLSPGCARNINKDGPRFGVRVRPWRFYGEIEDCKQSTGKRTNNKLNPPMKPDPGFELGRTYSQVKSYTYSIRTLFDGHMHFILGFHPQTQK